MESKCKHEQSAQAACLVRAGLKTCVFLPGDLEYQTSIGSYFSNTAKLAPACVFIPESTEQISRAVKALVAAKEKFAIRSGGHAPLSAANNIQNGVAIDLSQLNSIQYDAESKLVTFGPGVRWKHIYHELQKHERVVAGGREGETGVAGFLLGGGNTWFTAQKGFGCDNVVSYDIVLADGQIITAKQGLNADLFRALKGGSNNFGIVVKDIIVGGALVETRGVKDAPAFAEWFKLPKIMDTTKSKSILDMGLETALPYNLYDTWFTLTIKNDTRIMSKAAEIHDTLVEELRSYIPEGDFITQCLFQSLPMTCAKHSVAIGGNVMGIERNKSDGLIWQLNAMVKTADQNDFAYAKVKAGVKAIKEFAGSVEGGLLDWIYLNYADRSQDPLGSYGAENLRLLKEVAARYDPGRVFQTLCPGGFKLSVTDSYGVIAEQE
ncbi:uncharacterized protein JN550_012851 [Neoarthrinium moseri]|uniref:uncharacterized protein n=1 Tax=Neoarthrinium moseri TaxID=1658444 RepID=UPI001FDE1157|nr:uncharacterized protein JN550_012851 [Neoarthrinium moseri]KAI1858095.1 hypothetical protein JN550_012851 [Neoarthrinium moseri]